MKLYCIMIITILFYSCYKDDNSNKENFPTLQWKFKIDDPKLFTSFNPIIYKNKIICSKYFFDQRGSSIFALNQDTGEKLWEWNDFTAWDISGNYETYLYGNLFVFSFGGTTCVLDLDTGKTKWKIQTGEKGKNSIVGLGEKVYQVSFSVNAERYFINEININSGVWRNLLELEGRDTLVPFVEVPALQINQHNDTVLYISKILYNYSNYESENHLISYNLTKKTFEYDIIHEYEDIYQGSLGSPKIYDNKIYIPVDGYMFCYTINGELVWKKFIEGAFGGFAGFIFEEGKLFLGSEGFNPSLYAFNPNTGEQIWKTASSGTCSRLAYLNGVIYFTGGGDGLLHAVDAATGEHIWREESPDFKENSDAFFSRVMSIDAKTNQIYTASWVSILCYEAAR